tara:strand:- start:114 stop:1244 length:1131 start_codon:yes stop_codon:yes gene_type:complete
MSTKKKIIFLTSTRADFGKIKSLIKITKNQKFFDVYIVITGMHVVPKFGNTYKEVLKSFKKNIIIFKNQKNKTILESILSDSVNKFKKIIKRIKPDLIVIHGDRIEALALGLVGSLNHIHTAHVEGGEVSGTIDDTIRHAITKLSHSHFVGSKIAKKRVLKMGEIKENIYHIGSPDIDIIQKQKLPTIDKVKKRYSIKFREYSILLWHSVTSELDSLRSNTEKLVNYVNSSDKNFIVIYPNNDPGNEIILNCFKKINKKNKIIKNLRFEYFLSLLKNAQFIIGNSSSAIYEAPMLNTPAINIGNRQNKRLKTNLIKNIEISQLNENLINFFVKKYRNQNKNFYGVGNSDKNFLKVLKKKNFWNTPKQKFFSDKSQN